jgi:enoyl-CoA hydratase/carnithine racemase
MSDGDGRRINSRKPASQGMLGSWILELCCCSRYSTCTTYPSRRHNHQSVECGFKTMICIAATTRRPALYRRFCSSAIRNHNNSPLLLQTQQDGILTLTLNRPKQRNALNQQLIKSLSDALQNVSSDDDVRVVVLQSSISEGPVFCSGHDLNELLESSSEEHQAIFQQCSAMMQLLPSIPQPTICAVHGLATAAGCQLAAACDVVLASTRSQFCTPGVTTLGLFCHTPAVELVRCIGIKRSLDMLYTGRVLTAPEALEYGLISRMVANPQKQAQELAQTLASQSACAMQLGKQTVYQQAYSSTGSLDEAYGIASQAMVENMKTRDANHCIQSFLEKKQPT